MITSESNPHIKKLKKLTVPKYRKREGLFLVDDFKILKEAISCHYYPDEIYVSKEFKGIEKFNVIRVKENILSSISDLGSFSGIVAVFPMPIVDFETVSSLNKIVLLDGVQDPVNVGTILRSAVLFGLEGVGLLQPCADPFSLKAIRAGKGSIFHLPIIKLQKEQLSYFEKNKNLFKADANKGENLFKIDFKKPLVLVMGGEGHGLSEEVKKLKGTNILIPTTEKIDSLNVGSAASIIMSSIFNQLK